LHWKFGTLTIKIFNFLNPEISVVIAVYNGEKYIIETLDSIVSQTHKNWECIVVDDGSGDNTIEIIAKYIQADKRFRIIRTEGGSGPYIAANVGIKEAKGKFIARTDADDLSLPDRFAIQSDYLNKHSEINVCGTWHYHLFEGGKLTFKPYETDPAFLKWQSIFRNRIVHSTMMFRKGWFESIGYYPQKRLVQDWHTSLEAIHTNSLHVIKMPLIKWRIHGNSITRKENSLQLEEATKVVVFHLKNRVLLENIHADIVMAIIASIRGKKLSYEPDIQDTIEFVKRIYTDFCNKNCVNSTIKKKIKSDLHSNIDIFFDHYAKWNIKYLLVYLQSFFIAGGSPKWFRGLVRQLVKI
jgi:glycosyltransferase involved in cell wall biosynthesis